MKQIFAKRGAVIVDNVPVPMVGENSVLVQVAYSCISAGTELTSVSASGESLFQRAINQPGKVMKVVNALKKEGIKATIQKIRGKLDAANPLGYSAAGIILEVGKGVSDIQPGDKVACAGAGIANHAEYIDVPRNLLVKIPEGVGFDIASTVTLGAIAMQGVRRTEAKLGEFIAVIGLGILGQITVQLLKASGCRVIGIDLDERRIQKASEFGLDLGINPKNSDPVKVSTAFTGGFGVDYAIITAATNSKEPLAQAFQMCRKKGKVVLVGVVGMEINREDMYKKELDFLISTSYGPGRYDEEYEQKGITYPHAYVRWTENKNMEEYLRLIAEKKLDIKSLIENEYSIEEAPNAFEALQKQEPKPLIVLLKYGETKEVVSKRVEVTPHVIKKEGRINIALIGAGSFATSVHLPNLMKLKQHYNLYAIASRTGSKAKEVTRKYGAKYATSDYKEILYDKEVDAVIIATRHNLHASMAIEALKAGKAVFLEKPMALNKKELDELVKTINEIQKPFMVGFNRRFSPYVQEAKKHIAKRINPMIINYQMNAGYIPLDNWVHTKEGGGRIIGEACHIFDLFNFFTEAEVDSVNFETITPKNKYYSASDNVVITLKYRDDSVCNLVYTALGSNQYQKELCQVYFDGRIIIIDDYKKIKGYGLRVKELKSVIPEKGHYEELVEFVKFLKGETPVPIPLWQMMQTTEISFKVKEAL